MATSIGIYLMVFVAGFAVTVSQCPDNWVIFQGQCYFFSHEHKTFTESEHFCLQRGAHLVHVYSNTVNLFVKNMCRDLVSSAHWLGLYDVDIEGIWNWKHNPNQAANFTDWTPGEPTGGTSYNCAVLWPDYDYRWGDIDCSYAQARPICQKPVSCKCEEGPVIVG